MNLEENAREVNCTDGGKPHKRGGINFSRRTQRVMTSAIGFSIVKLFSSLYLALAQFDYAKTYCRRYYTLGPSTEVDLDALSYTHDSISPHLPDYMCVVHVSHLHVHMCGTHVREGWLPSSRKNERMGCKPDPGFVLAKHDVIAIAHHEQY